MQNKNENMSAPARVNNSRQLSYRSNVVKVAVSCRCQPICLFYSISQIFVTVITSPPSELLQQQQNVSSVFKRRVYHHAMASPYVSPSSNAGSTLVVVRPTTKDSSLPGMANEYD
jgi:hypothetical protein